MKRRDDMATTTLSYEIEVKGANGHVLASGVLTINIVTTSGPPPTRTLSGTFTPTNGTAITINVPTWNTTANGAVVWNFSLSQQNGDFPAGTYNFVGTENATGNDPGGTIVWPGLEGDIAENATWQGEATQPVEESQAYGQSGS
jgi:hypothetical protein